MIGIEVSKTAETDLFYAAAGKSIMGKGKNRGLDVSVFLRDGKIKASGGGYEKYRLRHVNFHSLRHSYISMLISQNETLKQVQALAGHANISTTVNTYGHLFPGGGRAAAGRLQETLFGGEKADVEETRSDSVA